MSSSPEALDRFRVLAEFSNDVVYIASPEGLVTWVSPALPRVLGWAPEAILDRPLRDLVHPDDVESALAWREVLVGADADSHGGGRSSDPIRFRRADGSYAWCTVSATRAYDADGEFVGITAALHDVDDLVRARLAAAQAHAYLHAVLEAQVDPMATLRAVRDAQGAIVDFAFEDANEPVARFHRTTVADLVGSTVMAVLGARAGGDDVAAAAEVLASGEAKIWNDVWSRVREQQGAGPTWLDIRIVPVDDDRVSYSWRDVTDRQLAQQRLVESEQRFRLLAETSSDVVYLAGVDRRITWVSPTIARTLGWTPEELIGQEAISLVHPDDVAATGPSRDAAYAAAPVPDPAMAGGYLMRARTRSGDYRWMMASNEVLTGTAGDVLGVSGSMRDVHELVLVQQEVARSRDLLRAVTDAQSDPHVLFGAVRDESGAVVDFEYQDANEAAADFERVPRDELRGQTIRSLYRSSEEADLDVADCARALLSGSLVARNDVPTLSYVDDLGRPVYVDIRVVKVDEDRVSYSWRDVTERHEAATLLAESEERFRLLAENMSDAVMLVRDGAVAWMSPSSTRALGWEAEELVGSDPFALVHPDDVAALVQAWEAADSGRLSRRRYRVRRRDGRYHWVEAEGAVVPDESAETRAVVISSRIVDAEVAALTALEAQARHDELTGLVNRHEVFDQLGRVLGGAVRSGTRVGMVFCDLDGFKEVNDEYGHTAGDALLRAIARRLERAVRTGDLVARVGGDELLVVLNGVRDLDDALLIADKLRVQVAAPTPVPGGVVTVTASLGVTLAEPGETVDAILARADAAMYEAKRRGKDAVVAFTPSEG